MGGHPQPDAGIDSRLNLLEEIPASVDSRCVSTSCEDEGCSLSLQGLDAFVYALLAMDGPHSPAPHGETRCDFLFFGNIPDSKRFWVSPVELTESAHKSSTRILDQLRAGGRLAERLVPENLDVQFAPVAAGPFGRFRRMEFRKIENGIVFRQRVFLATAVECGSELLGALRQSSGG